MKSTYFLLREDILNFLRSGCMLFFDYSEENDFVNKVAVLREGRLCMYQTVSLSAIPEEDHFELDPRLAGLLLAVAPRGRYPGHLRVVFSEGLSLVFVSVRPRLCLSH